MSAHFSRYMLNTYMATPYFEAHLPPDYQLGPVLGRAGLSGGSRRASGNCPPWQSNGRTTITLPSDMCRLTGTTRRGTS